MRILVLWTGPSGYLFSQLKALSKRGVQIDLCLTDIGRDAPFELSLIQTNFHSSFSIRFLSEMDSGLRDEFYEEHYDAVLICGWHIEEYLRIIRNWKVPRILYMDNQWLWRIKQFGGIVLRKIMISPYFDAAFVPGARQKSFAVKLGFNKELVIEGGCSCDSDIFSMYSPTWARNFTFVGRLSPEKGIAQLIKSYKLYRNSVKDPFELRLIGSGSLSELRHSISGVKHMNFVQPNDLPKIMSDSSCLILPSRREAWGVVVHEAVSIGLPIITSQAVGASDIFLKHGENGFLISKQTGSLETAMRQIHALSMSQLETFSINSKKLSHKISPNSWSQSLIELISNVKKFK